MKITTDWDFSTLATNQIETDETPFDWFQGALTENDLNSIKQNGVLLPLVVQTVPNSKYLLVDGFKRFRWLTTAPELSGQKKEIPAQFTCLVLPESMQLRDVAKIRLETLPVAENNFPGIQVCRLLKNLLRNGFSMNEMVSDVLPKLGLKSSTRLVRQLLDLAEKLAEFELHQQFQLPAAIMGFGCEDLLPLMKFSQIEFPAVIGLVEKMGVSGKKWRNLLQILDEVSRLKEMSATEVLKFPEILEIFGRSSLQAPARYRLLKQQLDLLRFPELSDLQQKFEQAKQSLKLAPRMMLESDQFFENDDLTLTLKIRNFDELQHHLKNLVNGVPELTKENTEELWNDLFAVLQEE